MMPLRPGAPAMCRNRSLARCVAMNGGRSRAQMGCLARQISTRRNTPPRQDVAVSTPASKPAATFTASRTSYLAAAPRFSRSIHTSAARPSAWAAAINVATNVVSNAVKRATMPKSELDLLRSIDPLRAVASEMKHLTGNLRKLLSSGHPSLERVSKYYTQSEGKHMRPMVVLLMSRATAMCPRSSRDGIEEREMAVNTPISNRSINFDVDPSLPSPGDAAARASPVSSQDILPTQRRLAEITELIHTASLLHDDVIDHSESRRGAPSANLAFGNKMAVLAGDFLLGRASIALARLRNAEIVELMATSISNLIEGEFLQLKNTSKDERNPVWSEDALSYYLQKTYLKTASLIALSCRSAAVLGGSDGPTAESAFQYGRNLGLAFQLVDDLLDYTRSAVELGKPAGADLQLGLATAPLLFAWKQMPELGALVGRKFAEVGDVEKARELVLRSDGIEQTRALAQEYADQAIGALNNFPDSEAKSGLIDMAQKALKRRK